MIKNVIKVLILSNKDEMKYINLNEFLIDFYFCPNLCYYIVEDRNNDFKRNIIKRAHDIYVCRKNKSLSTIRIL